MKKIYVSLLASCLIAFTANSALAQVASATITTVATPQVGFIYEMMSDTAVAELPTFTVSAGSATAQTWNYTTQFITTYTNPTSFVAPAGNPGAASFPTATLASNQGGSTWAYFSTSASGMNLIGVDITQMGVSVALTFTPAVQEFPTPFTYSNSVSSISKASTTTTFSSIPVTIVAHENQTITADAFGTITTPAGTYSNTLRYKIKSITSDSATSTLLGTLYSSIDSTIQYSWYENTTSSMVMSITMSASNDSVRKAQYLQSLQFAGISTVKSIMQTTNLYPNPTSVISYLSYENETSTTVSAAIFDVTGREVATLINNQQQAAGKQTVSIDVNKLQLPQGLYMVQLTVNGALKTLKLNVQ
jgi:hypothetical protein